MLWLNRIVRQEATLLDSSRTALPAVCPNQQRRITMHSILALQQLDVEATVPGLDTPQSSYSGSGCIIGPADLGEG